MEKQRFLNCKKIKFVDNSQKEIMYDGSFWYTLQAVRAANQAIGRIIRHAGDYGAVFLLDQRFGQEKYKKLLSKWLQQSL